MKARVLPLLAAVLVGCSAETGGTPVAEPSAPGSPGAPSTRPVSLAEVDPCALLTEEIAVEVGVEDVGAGRPDEIVEARQCSWFVDNWPEGDTYTVSISVDETLGLEDLPSDLDRTPLTVGSREAVLQPATPERVDVCSIIMYVNESSRVDASAVGEGEFDSCRMALRLAELIEPALPLE